MKVALVTAPAEEPVKIEDAKQHLRVDIEDDDSLILSMETVAREHAENVTHRKFITQTWRYYLDEWPEKDYIELPFPPLQSVSSLKYTDYNLTETTLSTTITQATGSISITNTPVAGEHLTVGSQIFHFRAIRAIAGEITINADNTTQATNIAAALTLDIPTIVTAISALGVVSLTAVAIGTLGNSVILTTDATGVGVTGTGTLSGGTDSNYVVDAVSEPGKIVLAYGETWPTATLHVSNPIVIEFVCGYGTPDDVPEGLKAGIKVDLADLYEQREAWVQGVYEHLPTIDRLYASYRIFRF